MTILLAIYDGLIIRSLSSGLDLLYNLIRANKSVSAVRVLSEWYYLIDKLFYLISPHIISYGSSRENILHKSNIFSPFIIYQVIKSFIISMFSISVWNVLIWGFIVSYFHPMLFQKVIHFLGSINWSDITGTLTQIDYKKISDYIGLSSLFFSTMVIFLLTSSSFKWKAMKKVNEEKYEKAMKHQEIIEGLLGSILVSSKKNIDSFNHMIKYLPDMFGELITHTNKYRLEKGILKIDESSNFYSNTKLEDLTRGYESFREQVNKVNEILKIIYESRLYYVFNKINKSVRYETLKLSLFYKTHLDWELIESENFKEEIAAQQKALSYLTKDFIQLKDVWGGWLKKEVLEEEFNKHGGSFTYEKIVRYRESELAQEMLKFDEFLHRKLEDAIFHHIVLEQYIESSHKNTRFNLLRVLFSYFGTK